MTVADDLRAAAQYMREHGLARETAEADDGSVCALGAIAHALGSKKGIWYETNIPPRHRSRFDYAVGTLTDYLWSINTLDRFVTIPNWSDGSSIDDVVIGMEKAAAWVEEQA